MKAIWKILIGATAVAAVTPYKVQKDEETGSVKLTSATWSATYTKGDDGKHIDVRLLPAFAKHDKCECGEDEECCCCGDEDDNDDITIDVDAEMDDVIEAAEEAAEEAEAVAEAVEEAVEEAAEETEETEEPRPEEA